MNRSPDKPWQRGVNPTYTAYRLTVNICQDGHGNVWSDHDFETLEDERIAGEMAQGGAPQLAHALLTEAVRREVFVCALIEQTRDAGFLARWKTASEKEKERMEGDLDHAARHVIGRTLVRMVPGAVAEILAMMADNG